MTSTTTKDWESLSIEELEHAVRYHNRRYWVDQVSEISDPEFDRLIEALRSKSPHSAVLDAIGPAGAALEDGEGLDGEEELPKVRHEPPMLSLEKCYDEETLLKWFEKFDGDALVSPKVDGVALCIQYDEQGELALGATRGNGTVGELITENVRHIVDVPERIERGPMEFRGEAYMPRSIFERRFAADYMSPRNLTAGALKRKDGARTADYEIHFFCYDVLGVERDTESEKLEFARSQGLTPVPSERVTHEALQRTYDALAAERQSLNYETDGVVYKVDDARMQERMGRTAHHPRFAIAYKFQGDSGQSTLREMEWSVSRTGAINPIGLVDPVSLSGAMVSRVSLHNLAILEGLGGEDGLRLNSRVLMMRRGGVIPNLEKVLEPGDELVAIPQACPVCGAQTYRKGDVLFAEHRADCSTMKVRQLAHYVKAMEIKGFGDKILEQLVDAGLVVELVDFYRLSGDDLLALDRMGEKLATKLLEQLEARRRQVPAARFLRALGIPELGKHVSKILSQSYGSIEQVFALTSEELAAIHTIGEVIAKSVVEGLAERREEIEGLLEFVEIVFAESKPETELFDTELLGKRVLFTGTLSSMTRKAAQKRVLALGGQAPSGVSKELDYLVIGEEDMARYEGGWRSSKLKKADAYNEQGAHIEVLGEERFKAMLERAEEIAGIWTPR